eukprot:c3736_g1_i1 orf=387-1685(+)
MAVPYSVFVPFLLFSYSFLGGVCQQLQTTNQCDGRRVYMYDLPSEFNSGLLEKCKFGMAKWLNFCAHNANAGMGQALEKVNNSHTLGQGWYITDPYMIEVIFHNRMRRYSCLTKNPKLADAFFLPYYTGIDALKYLYNANGINKSRHGANLISWLEKNANDQWQKHGGRDHFLIMGRTSWDFDFHEIGNYSWGTGLWQMPQVTNMTGLLVEKRTWMPNEQAIPYPTSFHPSISQLQEWMNNVRAAERTFLFSFAGSIRPTMRKGGIRDILLQQCAEAHECILVDCKKHRCSHNPQKIIETFSQSTFCLQPRGDTPTRRSIFDSIIAGCIPVLFHPESAYTQYTWHLPQDSNNWSVFIAEDDIKNGARVENILGSYSQEQILQIRNRVITLIPNLIYTTSSGEDSATAQLPDAFDIIVQGVLHKISAMKLQET